MPSKKDELKKEDIIGIVVGTVVGTGLLLALFIVFRQRRRERRLRAEFEKAATFAEGATAYRTKSIGTEDEEMSPRPSSNGHHTSVSRSISGSRYSEAPPDSAISELNPYNYRMRPELANIKSSSRVELLLPGDEKVRSGPHELEAGTVVTFPRSARVANHVLGESDSEAGSPVLEMKEVKI